MYNQMYVEWPKMIKIIKKQKNIKKQGIVILKNTEKSITDIFNIVKEEYLSKIEKTQIPQLKGLLEKEDFSVYDIRYVNPEEEKNGNSALRKIMKLELAEKDAELPTA